MKKYNVAIIGSTGAVGNEILTILPDYNINIGDVISITSSKNVGKFVEYNGAKLVNQELKTGVFKENNIDIAIFATDSSIVKKFNYIAKREKVVIIDTSSYYRLKDNIPLISAGVNYNLIKKDTRNNILASPNCVTIQLTQVIGPLELRYGIKRVDITTYQAVSGAGRDGISELLKQKKAFVDFNMKNLKNSVFPHRIEMNIIPKIGNIEKNGFTGEEMKIVNETQKILNKNIEIGVTCVRVPTLRSHSESIMVELEENVDISDLLTTMQNSKYIKVLDDPQNDIYPMPIISTDTDYTYVGRIRKDIYNENKIHIWSCSDQLRVGAATNAIRILKKYINCMES